MERKSRGNDEAFMLICEAVISPTADVVKIGIADSIVPLLPNRCQRYTRPTQYDWLGDSRTTKPLADIHKIATTIGWRLINLADFSEARSIASPFSDCDLVIEKQAYLHGKTNIRQQKGYPSLDDDVCAFPN